VNEPVQPRPKKIDVHGWLILDKPSGMTSTQALSRVKRAFGAKKAGHAGTLDPLATGCLPIAFGEATKTVPFAMDGRKIYRFTVAWGVETDTDDSEGRQTETSESRPSAEDVRALLPGFTGTILQTPPQYSALKVDGERAYDLARDGEVVDLATREITIHRLELVENTDDYAVFETETGKGAYVRALARDMGRLLGCFGHISALRRVQVGPFEEGDLISLDEVERLRLCPPGEGNLADHLLPVETALDDIPALAVNGADAARLRRGQAVLLRGRDAPLLSGTCYVTEQGALVALAEAEGGEIHPKRVFHLPG
jgi:tRNA pseudouridine55 synthase